MKKRSRRRWQLDRVDTFLCGRQRTRERSECRRSLPDCLPPNTICKSQTSSSAASRLAAASSSPFHTFTHSNHQLILLHLIFMRVSIFFSSPVSIPHNISSFQCFAAAAVLAGPSSLLSIGNHAIHELHHPILIHWDFCVLSFPASLAIGKKICSGGCCQNCSL